MEGRGHYNMFELKPNEQIFMKLGIGSWCMYLHCSTVEIMQH